jgi:hypothetical protein
MIKLQMEPSKELRSRKSTKARNPNNAKNRGDRYNWKHYNSDINSKHRTQQKRQIKKKNRVETQKFGYEPKYKRNIYDSNHPSLSVEQELHDNNFLSISTKDLMSATKESIAWKTIRDNEVFSKNVTNIILIYMCNFNLYSCCRDEQVAIDIHNDYKQKIFNDWNHIIYNK